MRRGHNRARTGDTIKPITKDNYPKRLIIFDTEAYRSERINDVEKQTLRLGVARYIELDNALTVLDDEYYQFTTVEGLLAFIVQHQRKDKTLFVYAHNIKYDLQLTGLLKLMLEDGYEVTKFVMNDPPTFIRLRRNRSLVMFVDTFNYWQTSVAKMGDTLGLAKLVMPDENESNEPWFVYCERDVKVLSEYLLSYMNWLMNNNLGGMALTLAGQAFRTYRHNFLESEITIHNYPKPLHLERDSYSGARTEAFYQGDLSGQDWYKLDVNSMYPYVMKMDTYPIKMKAHTVNIPIDRLKKLLERYYVIASVVLDTPEPVYPSKHEGKLVFPVGRFVTSLHDSELRYALEYGHIQEVLEVSIYDRGGLFTEYIDYFYQLKQAADASGDKISRHLAKTLMNSLYGKFGQRGIVSKLLPNKSTVRYGRYTGYSESMKKNITINYLGDQIELSYPLNESYYSMPAIAGAVTANARMYLWRLIQVAKPENVKYIDTDSLIVNREGYELLSNLLDDAKLGYLKLEGLSNRFVIRGLKDYQFGEDNKTKGVPKSAKPVDANTWIYDQFRGALGWLSDGLSTGVTVKQTTKHRSGIYTKGEVQPSGDITPLRFG